MNTDRRNLKRRNGERLRFRGRVDRFGEKSAYRGPPLKTLMLTNVMFVDTGEFATAHLWFTAGKWANGVKVGDMLEFDGRIDKYIKGYMGYREDVWDKPISADYRISRPTKVVNLGREPVSESCAMQGRQGG